MRCLAWDVSPVAPNPFGFLPVLPLFSFSFFFLCVLYYKFILYITRGAPNKAVEKKIFDTELRKLIEVFYEIVDFFSRLICALNLHFAQTLLRKTKCARGC